jgi:predicted AlkP superfamily phosphohydrolase/phosphomutase
LKGGKLRQWLTYKAYSFVNSRVGGILYRYFISLGIKKKKAIPQKDPHKTNLAQKENVNIPWGVNRDDTIAVGHGINPLGINIVSQNLPQDQDYEKIREEIINKLNHLTIDGRKVIQNAWKKEDIFNGRYISQVPDIVYLTSEDSNASTTLSKKVFNKRKKIGNRGAHEKAREGIFLAYGQDIKQGMKLGEANITDIAPTILHLYDVPVLEDMDGRVLKEIFKEDSEASQRPVRYQRVSEQERLRAKVRKLKALKNV